MSNIPRHTIAWPGSTTRLFSFCAGPAGASSADSNESRCEPSRCRLALPSSRARFAAAACWDDMGLGYRLTGRCAHRLEHGRGRGKGSRPVAQCASEGWTGSDQALELGGLPASFAQQRPMVRQAWQCSEIGRVHFSSTCG